MQTDSSFVVQFWGVRGSIPTPGASTVRYGGNTACVEILAGHKRIILDGGTGLSVLGKHLLKQAADIEAHIFFTHTHWDRIQGFPFFVPAFTEGNQFHIYGATAPNGASIKQCLTDQMLQPNFPTPLQRMRSHLNFSNISAGNTISIDDVVIETILLNQLTSALGYRITWQGRSVVYATDTDHSQEASNHNLQRLAHQANVLIYDGTYADYTEHNLQKQSLETPWKEGIGVARAAKVEELIMFHHNPAHDDDWLDLIEMQIRGDFPSARLAREGMILQVL
ncbi:MAG: MBL fold metallo-hydrolase [Leptolyngbyaceae cyanobacterium SM1_1_3]|nr:MBL fold metallo-hydrolase [Leptolyngbyaceae cyanobacterium SM1_1_3]NJO09832.1 MBL fold metallo-hydrolase [Leptolyngbyaceae cyanobacterium SL_1_1]